MTTTTAELVLHPVRLRIVQRFLGDRDLTTADLRRELGDIAPATLYRHIARLADAGVLEVVAEQRIRGAVERTYALRLAAAQVEGDDLAAMSPDQHRQAFLAFVAGLLAGFDRYLESGDVDLVRDGAGYRQYGLWLTEAELAEFVDDLRGVVVPRLEHRPGPGRARRLFTTVLFPADGPPVDEGIGAG